MFLNCTHCCFEHGWTLPEVLYIFANDYKLKLMHSCLLARMWYVCQKKFVLVHACVFKFYSCFKSVSLASPVPFTQH